jgi:hypothetical protein
MTFIAVAIGAAVGIGGAAISANSAKKAQQGANATNAQNVADTNAQNLELFNRSRGSEGSAILPMYFGEGEAQLGQQAFDFSQMLLNAGGTPDERLRQYGDITDSYKDIMISGDDLIRELYSGGTLQKRLAGFEPLAGARTAKAAGQASAFDQALAEVTNRMDAENHRRGFSGGSSFANNRLLDATYGARRGSSDVLADANVLNAQDRFGLGESDLDLRMRNLDFAPNRAQQRLTLEGMPQAMLANQYGQALQPLDFFRMQPQAFQNQPLPQVSAVPGSGQIVGTALAGLGATLGNYGANEQLMKYLQQQNAPKDVNFGIYG